MVLIGLDDIATVDPLRYSGMFSITEQVVSKYESLRVEPRNIVPCLFGLVESQDMVVYIEHNIRHRMYYIRVDSRRPHPFLIESAEGEELYYINIPSSIFHQALRILEITHSL